jgi:hypothetical protein
MAVPSSITPLRRRERSVCTVFWSLVRGHCVKASPANATTPILSPKRSATNSPAICLAAVMRSGLKSRASIDPEMSIASTMSIPSVELSTLWLTSLGRANATMSAASAARRNATGTCRSQ